MLIVPIQHSMGVKEPRSIGLLKQDSENPAVGLFPENMLSSGVAAVNRSDLIYWGEWPDWDALVVTRHRTLYDSDSRFTELGQSLLNSDGATMLPPPVIDRVTQWEADELHFVQDEAIPMVCLLMSDDVFQKFIGEE